MATIELTKDNFEEVITGNNLVIVDFWAPWCGPCKNFAPIYEEASEKNADVVYAKVNTEEETELAGHFQIRSIPTLMVFSEQVVVFSQPGMLPASGLDELVTQIKALDMDKVRADIAKEQSEQA